MVQYIEFLFDNFTFTFVHWPPSSQLFDSFLSLPIDKANTDRKTNREGTFFSANTRNWNIHYFCFVTKKTQKICVCVWERRKTCVLTSTLTMSIRVSEKVYLNDGLIWGKFFILLPQMTLKILLALKAVKRDPKIMLSSFL